MPRVTAWRREAAQAVGGAGFLRLGRDEGTLFVSDYPRRCPEAERVTAALESAGFSVTVQNGMAYIDGGTEKYALLAESLPGDCEKCPLDGDEALYRLCDRLLHGSGTESPDACELRLCLRALDGGDTRELTQLLPGLLAERQRTGRPLPRRLCGLISALCASRGGE